MKNILALISLILIFTSVCVAQNNHKSPFVYLQNPKDLLNPNDSYEYMILKNDHLSHLAYKFYQNGLIWEKIYIANPYIIDPNWIYPDNWLIIPDIHSDKNGDPIIEKQSFNHESADSLISFPIIENSLIQDDNEHLYVQTNLVDTPTQNQHKSEEIDFQNSDLAIKTVYEYRYDLIDIKSNNNHIDVKTDSVLIHSEVYKINEYEEDFIEENNIIIIDNNEIKSNSDN